MNRLTNEQWQNIFTKFCHNCFMFHKREGDSIAVAFDKGHTTAKVESDYLESEFEKMETV